MTERRDRLEQATVRIEKLIWLPGAIATGAIPEDLKDALVDDLYDGDSKHVLEKLPSLKALLTSEDEPDEDWIVEALYSKSGFFAQMARPIPTDFFGEYSHSFSWGYYATRWVYVDDLDELVSVAEEFSESIVESARAKAKKAEQAVLA